MLCYFETTQSSFLLCMYNQQREVLKALCRILCDLNISERMNQECYLHKADGTKWGTGVRLSPCYLQFWDRGPSKGEKCSTSLPAPELPGRTKKAHKKQWGSSGVCPGEPCAAFSPRAVVEVPSPVALSEQRSLEERNYFHSFED